MQKWPQSLERVLFSGYVDEKHKLFIPWKSVAYADDTVLFCKSDNFDKTFGKVEKELYKISHWLSKNVITLNTLKTKYSAFSIDVRKQPLNTSLKGHSSNCKIDDNFQCTNHF